MDMPRILWKHSRETGDPVWRGVVGASRKAYQEKVRVELSLKELRYRASQERRGQRVFPNGTRVHSHTHGKHMGCGGHTALLGLHWRGGLGW